MHYVPISKWSICVFSHSPLHDVFDSSKQGRRISQLYDLDGVDERSCTVPDGVASL